MKPETPEEIASKVANAKAMVQQTQSEGLKPFSTSTFVPPPESSTFPATQIGQTKPLQFPPQYQDNTNYAGVMSGIPSIEQMTTEEPPTQAEQQQTGAVSRLSELFRSVTGVQKQEAQTKAEEAKGLPQFQSQLTDINNQIQALQKESLAQNIQIEQDSIGKGITTRTVQSQQAGAQRLNTIKALQLSAIAQTLQGNISNAKAQADRAVDLEFAPKEAEIEYLQNFLSLNEKTLSREDRKKAEKLQIQIDERKRFLDEEKENRGIIMGWAAEASKNGAPTLLVNRAIQSRNPSEALTVLSPYFVDQNEKEQALAELEQTRAQTAQIYANIAKTKADTQTTQTQKYVADKMSNLDYTSPTFTLDMIRTSTGGKTPTGEQTKPINKASLVLSQLGELQTNIEKSNTGPILGILRDNNPYDIKAQLIKAQLQAITPNLARGVYGEVGVLTDTDIKNYIQTLPDLRKPEEANRLILGMTLRVVKNAIDSQLQVLAAEGRDVSGFEPIYKQLQERINTIEGVGEKQQNTTTDSMGNQIITTPDKKRFRILPNGNYEELI